MRLMLLYFLTSVSLHLHKLVNKPQRQRTIVKEKMIFFYVMITALPTTAMEKGSLACNLSEPIGAQCFGALGEPLIFFQPTTTRTHKKTLKKNTVSILKITNNTVENLNNDYSNRFALVTNATFKLDKATKNESGDYQLETFDSEGRALLKVNFHLEILAPVSQPAVSQMCLSSEKKVVSCSSEGDGVEFILNLDNNILIQTRAGSTDKNNTPKVSNVTISLHGQLTGNLMCQVQNNVSREAEVIHLKSCTGSICHTYLVTLVVAASVSTLLLHLALFLCIKHLNKKTTVTVNEDNAEDEIVYSDITVKNTEPV